MIGLELQTTLCGRRMFDGMDLLEPKKLDTHIFLFPLFGWLGQFSIIYVRRAYVGTICPTYDARTELHRTTMTTRRSIYMCARAMRDKGYMIYLKEGGRVLAKVPPFVAGCFHNYLPSE
jgi:hypothetical protein